MLVVDPFTFRQVIWETFLGCLTQVMHMPVAVNPIKNLTLNSEKAIKFPFMNLLLPY